MNRILIVDDEPHVVRVLSFALERQGYEVSAAANGEDALAAIRVAMPQVLITDVVMPRMGGEELCRSVRREWPDAHLPIFVMTSRAERESRIWVQELSNVNFLEKPVSPRMLIGRLESCLAGMSTGRTVPSP